MLGTLCTLLVDPNAVLYHIHKVPLNDCPNLIPNIAVCDSFFLSWLITVVIKKIIHFICHF